MGSPRERESQTPLQSAEKQIVGTLRKAAAGRLCTSEAAKRSATQCPFFSPRTRTRHKAVQYAGSSALYIRIHLPKLCG